MGDVVKEITTDIQKSGGETIIETVVETFDDIDHASEKAHDYVIVSDDPSSSMGNNVVDIISKEI